MPQACVHLVHLSNLCLCMALQESSYTKMWYKRCLRVGIKRKGAGQIMSFGGKRCKLTKEVLMDYGDQCLTRLDAGRPVEAVKNWVDGQIC